VIGLAVKGVFAINPIPDCHKTYLQLMQKRGMPIPHIKEVHCMKIVHISCWKLLVAAAVLLLSGCSGGSGGSEGSGGGAPATTGQTPKEKIATLEASGAIPKLDRSSTISGIDANANGVRDDIEAYITSNYTVAPQKAAAIQTAKAVQATLLVDTTNITAVKEANIKLSKAVHCTYLRFDGSNSSKTPAQVSQEIESMTTNTKERLKAYLNFNKALDGTSWAMPEGDTCE